MIRPNIAPGEYYHLYNRGNDKQNIFRDTRDYIRFLFLILYFQSPISFYNMSRPVSYFVRHRMFNTGEEGKVVKQRQVQLISFCLMPNHFHLLVGEQKERGISKYMQKVLNAYTKYFNSKYQRSGHLFQGPYKAVHINDNEQLVYLSAYIHRNPHKLGQWRGKEEGYIWSSYRDYTGENRWGELLKRDIIFKQYNLYSDYRAFVESSGAKDDEFQATC